MVKVLFAAHISFFWLSRFLSILVCMDKSFSFSCLPACAIVDIADHFDLRGIGQHFLGYSLPDISHPFLGGFPALQWMDFQRTIYRKPWFLPPNTELSSCFLYIFPSSNSNPRTFQCTLPHLGHPDMVRAGLAFEIGKASTHETAGDPMFFFKCLWC